MKCARVKAVLSEYIDGALDKEIGKEIDKHISRCPTCKEEFVAMRSLVEELRSLEQVKAPDDFLEKLHERTKPGFSLRRIMSVLFVPGRVKLPLEFASAVTVAILILFMLNIEQPQEMILSAPRKSTNAITEEKITVNSVKAPGKKATHQGGPAFDEIAPELREQEREPIQLALLLTGASGRTVCAPIILPKAVSPGRGAERAQPAVVPPDAGIGADAREGEPAAMGFAREEDSLLTKKTDLPSSILEEVYHRVKDLVVFFDGRVLRGEDETPAVVSTSLHLEIPVETYYSFCEKLEGLADLQSPPSTILGKEGDTVRIHIRFICSE